MRICIAIFIRGAHAICICIAEGDKLQTLKLELLIKGTFEVNEQKTLNFTEME